MRRWWLWVLVAFLWVCVFISSIEAAPDGSSQKPIYTRQQQGGSDEDRMSCGTSSTPIPVDSSGCRSILFRSDSTNRIYICRAATCAAADAGMYLDEGDSVTRDWSANGTWSCIAVGGAGNLHYAAECGEENP